MSVATIHASARHTSSPDARAHAACGRQGFVGKVLEIRQERPGRIQVVLTGQVVGF